MQPWIPSPEQIQAACAAIQAEWSTAEEQRRRAGGNAAEPWVVPDVKAVGVREE